MAASHLMAAILVFVAMSTFLNGGGPSQVEGHGFYRRLRQRRIQLALLGASTRPYNQSRSDYYSSSNSSRPGYGRPTLYGDGSPGYRGDGYRSPGYGRPTLYGDGGPGYRGDGYKSPGYGSPGHRGYGSPAYKGYGSSAYRGYGRGFAYGNPGYKGYGYKSPSYRGPGYDHHDHGYADPGYGHEQPYYRGFDYGGYGHPKDSFLGNRLSGYGYRGSRTPSRFYPDYGVFRKPIRRHRYGPYSYDYDGYRSHDQRYDGYAYGFGPGRTFRAYSAYGGGYLNGEHTTSTAEPTRTTPVTPASMSTSPPPPECVGVKPAYRQDYSYGSQVATCDAIQAQQARREALDRRIDMVNDTLTTRIADLTVKLPPLEDDIDSLKGEAELARLFAVTLNVFDARFVCTFNTMVETAEICKILGIPRPDPFFFHISCTDPRAQSLGISCFTNFWVLKPNCLRPNSNNLGDCLESNGPNTVCTDLVVFSCTGFTEGLFAEDDNGLNQLNLFSTDKVNDILSNNSSMPVAKMSMTSSNSGPA